MTTAYASHITHCAFEVRYRYIRSVPASTGGCPDSWTPGEGAEIEIEEVSWAVKEGDAIEDLFEDLGEDIPSELPDAKETFDRWVRRDYIYALFTDAVVVHEEE